MASKEQTDQIVRLVASLDDGSYIVEHADGRLERKKSETDWARLQAMTEEEIEAAARADPEWRDDIDWSKAELAMPRRKGPISIRLDDDILSYFKGLGAGYQTRINAILRHFMEHARSKQK